jgi:hypothetical protein
LSSHSLVDISEFVDAGKETFEDFTFAQQHNLDFALIIDLDREPAAVVQKICKQKNELQIFGKLSSNVVAPMVQPYLVKYYDGFWGSSEEPALWTTPLINEFIEMANSSHFPICGYVSDSNSDAITVHERLDGVVMEWPLSFDTSKKSLLPDFVQKFIQIAPKALEIAACDMPVGMMLSLARLSVSLEPVAVILLSRTGRSAKILSRLELPCKIIVVTTSRRVACSLRFFRNLEALWWSSTSGNIATMLPTGLSSQ